MDKVTLFDTSIIGYQRPADLPELAEWDPENDDQIFFYFDHDTGIMKGRYKEKLHLSKESPFHYFRIIKNHYCNRMDDIVRHINYFCNFFDDDKEFFLSLYYAKSYLDRNPSIKFSRFEKVVINKIVTDNFVNNVKRMARALYNININTDRENKFKATPKITNEQARMIVAISFCFRLILPLCIHFSNISTRIKQKKDYIPIFDSIFMKCIDRFEEDDVKIYGPLCEFTEYRVNRSHNADLKIWIKKKHLYGDAKEINLQSLIHEVILVKGLYKLSYNKSVVSFTDGLISNDYKHFIRENFPCNPVEIEQDEGDGDYLSRAEALEMSIYRIDESNMIVNEVNTEEVIKRIEREMNIDISQEEFQFYFDRVQINQVTQTLINSFYSNYFNNANTTFNLNRTDKIKLIIYLKKYLQLRGMIILPQICTATMKSKYRDSSIKNTKFIEKYNTSSVYKSILEEKYKYVQELNPKDDFLLKKISSIIQSTFIWVDPDPEINGVVCEDMDLDRLNNEIQYFFAIC